MRSTTGTTTTLLPTLTLKHTSFHNVSLYMLIILSLCTISSSSATTTTTQRRADGVPFIPYGFQSGGGTSTSSISNDDSYAGSLYLDKESNTLYLTGGTYGYYFDSTTPSESSSPPSSPSSPPENETSAAHLDDCFVSVLQLPTTTTTNKKPELLYTRRFGTETNAEVCSAIQYLPTSSTSFSSKKIVSIGHTQGSNGFFTSLRRTGSDISKVYGFVMDLDINDNNDDDNEQGTLNGGMLFHENAVQYPIAFLSSPYNPITGGSTSNTAAAAAADIYVLMMESDIDSLNDNFVNDYQENIQKNIHPDLTAGGGGAVHQPYGSTFDMTIKKLSWKSEATLAVESPTEEEGLKHLLFERWSRTYSTEENDENVIASAMLYITASGEEKDDALIITGSTRGSGVEFGGQKNSRGEEEEETMDGFITKLVLPSSGNPPPSISTSSARVASEDGRDELISAICANYELDVTEFFVVGSVGNQIPENGIVDTISGSGSPSSVVLNAFITKIDAQTLESIWTKELYTIKNHGSVLGLGCAVTSDGKEVYLAGTVTNGAVVDLSSENVYPITRSYGGSDVYITKLSTDTGKILYGKQMGTRQDEMLARGGNGGGIVTDGNGNAIIMGNTRGNFMRQKSDAKDDNDDVDVASDVFVLSISRQTGDFQEAFDKGFEVKHGKRNGKVSAFGVFFIIVCILSIVISMIILHKEQIRDVIYRKFSRDGSSSREEANVSQFLDDFGDVDVEIRHSATGGFHGMYDFPDKGGDNNVAAAGGAAYEAAPPDEVTVSLELISPTDAATSTVKESLFLEDDDHVVLTSRSNNSDDKDDGDGDGDVMSDAPSGSVGGEPKKMSWKKIRKSSSVGSYSHLNTDEDAFTIDDDSDDDENDNDAMSAPIDVEELEKTKKRGRKLRKSKSAGNYSQVNTNDDDDDDEEEDEKDTLKESQSSKDAEDSKSSSTKKLLGLGRKKKDEEVADDHVPLVDSQVNMNDDDKKNDEGDGDDEKDTLEESQPSQDAENSKSSSTKKLLGLGRKKKDEEVEDDHVPLVEDKEII